MGDRMLNIGVVGLGNIAQKAYLPVYAELQDQAQFYLVSRDLQKVTRIANKYHMVAAGTELDAVDERTEEGGGGKEWRARGGPDD
mgnify:CR=1 FL=1